MYIGNQQVKKRYIGSQEVLKSYIGYNLVYSKETTDPLILAAQAAGSVLYLDARKATGAGLPANSPLTSPWKDLSGASNNAVPTNFAGTTASGVDIANPTKPSWVLDGSNDFFDIANSTSLDITSAPLAVFATIKQSALASGTMFIFAKNLSAAENTQYGLMIYFSNDRIRAYLNGTSLTASDIGGISLDVWYNIGFIWDGTNVKYFINGVQSGSNISFSGALISREKISVGRRAASSYFNGNIAAVSVYSGENCVEAKVLAAEQAISAAYLAA